MRRLIATSLVVLLALAAPAFAQTPSQAASTGDNPDGTDALAQATPQDPNAPPPPNYMGLVVGGLAIGGIVTGIVVATQNNDNNTTTTTSTSP